MACQTAGPMWCDSISHKTRTWALSVGSK